MTYPVSLGFLVMVALLSGCSPPGKPKPLPNNGLPTPVMAFDALYADNCAGCHGKEGRLGPAPPLNDPLFLHIVSDAELSQVIADGRPGTPMPPFDKAKGGQLDTAQLQALVHGLKQTWMGAAGSANPPPYSATSVGDAARGVKIFASACAGCHGPDGKGGLFKERPIGSINDASFLTLTSDQVLRRYIITGRPDLEMPSFQERTGRSPSFEPLSAQDVSDLTALLVSWRKPLAKH